MLFASSRYAWKLGFAAKRGKSYATGSIKATVEEDTGSLYLLLLP